MICRTFVCVSGSLPDCKCVLFCGVLSALQYFEKYFSTTRDGKGLLYSEKIQSSACGKALQAEMIRRAGFVNGIFLPVPAALLACSTISWLSRSTNRLTVMSFTSISLHLKPVISPSMYSLIWYANVFPAIKKMKNGHLPDFNDRGELIEIAGESKNE